MKGVVGPIACLTVVVYDNVHFIYYHRLIINQESNPNRSTTPASG